MTLSIHVVRSLVDAVVAAGVTRSSFLSAARLCPSLLANDQARIARWEMFRLCELALELTGDDAFGLHWGVAASDNAFTLLSQLIASSPNLGVGLQRLFEYQRLVSDECFYERIEQGDCIILRSTPRAGSSPQLERLVVEMEAVGMFRLMRCFGAKARPTQVSFTHQAPAYRVEYARIFQGVEHFEQPHNEITFSKSLLREVPPQRDEAVCNALQAIAERRLQQLTEPTPFTLRVRDELVRRGPNAHADMDQIARSLDISPRSLRRRLEAEGSRYSQVAHEVAIVLAKQLLEDKSMSIQQTAFAMGFADSSSFHRAFKRWTGLTPRSYLEGGQ